MFVTIDRTSKFALVMLHEKAKTAASRVASCCFRG